MSRQKKYIFYVKINIVTYIRVCENKRKEIIIWEWGLWNQRGWEERRWDVCELDSQAVQEGLLLCWSVSVIILYIFSFIFHQKNPSIHPSCISYWSLLPVSYSFMSTSMSSLMAWVRTITTFPCDSAPTLCCPLQLVLSLHLLCIVYTCPLNSALMCSRLPFPTFSHAGMVPLQFQMQKILTMHTFCFFVTKI